MRRSGNVAFTSVLLALSAVFLVLTLGFDESSRVVPLSVAGSLSGLLLVQIVRDVREGRQATAPIPTDAPLEAAAVGWLLALGALILLFGMLLGPTLFVSVYLRRKAAEGWLVTIGGGATTALVFWLVLTHAIGAPVSLGAVGALVGALLGIRT